MASANIANRDTEEITFEVQNCKWLLSRCGYFADRSLDLIWEIILPVGLSLTNPDAALLIQFCSTKEPDVFSLHHHSIETLIAFSDYFKCNFLLKEYFKFFISRDLLLTYKDFYKVLCHFGIDHEIVTSSLRCYSTTLDIDYQYLKSLLYSGDGKKKYAIFKFRTKLRNVVKSREYRNRIGHGNCQVGRHPIVVLPTKDFEETLHMKWGVLLQCCGSVCCQRCYDWIKTRPAMALANATTCPICNSFLDIRTLEYLWEHTEVLEERDRHNQLVINGLHAHPHGLPIPQRPLAQPPPPKHEPKLNLSP